MRYYFDEPFTIATLSDPNTYAQDEYLASFCKTCVAPQLSSTGDADEILCAILNGEFAAEVSREINHLIASGYNALQTVYQTQQTLSNHIKINITKTSRGYFLVVLPLKRDPEHNVVLFEQGFHTMLRKATGAIWHGPRHQRMGTKNQLFAKDRRTKRGRIYCGWEISLSKADVACTILLNCYLSND